MKIPYRGMTGWARREDLAIFHYPNPDYYGPAGMHAAIRHEVREAVLDSQDWPEGIKRAIRENRVERGMTKEQVRIAWGRPARTEGHAEGGERWTYHVHRYWRHGTVVYHYYPGLMHGYYDPIFGWDYAVWGPWAYPEFVTTFEPVPYTRTVEFNAKGKVIAWKEGKG